MFRTISIETALAGNWYPLVPLVMGFTDVGRVCLAVCVPAMQGLFGSLTLCSLSDGSVAWCVCYHLRIVAVGNGRSRRTFGMSCLFRHWEGSKCLCRNNPSIGRRWGKARTWCLSLCRDVSKGRRRVGTWFGSCDGTVLVPELDSLAVAFVGKLGIVDEVSVALFLVAGSASDHEVVQLAGSVVFSGDEVLHVPRFTVAFPLVPTLSAAVSGHVATSFG